MRVPGMLHGRVVRPSGVGAKLVKVDEDSVKGMPGYVQTVVKGNFVGVVAENEWAAIQAAKKLKVTWSAPAAGFSRTEKFVQVHAHGDSQGKHGLGEHGRRGGGAGKRGEKSGSEIRLPFSIARHDGTGLRRGRCPHRWHHHGVVRRAEAARAAKRLRRTARRSARSRSRDLDGRRRIVRPPWIRGRRRGRGAALARSGQAGARAVDARGHDFVGLEGTGGSLRSRSRARRAWRGDGAAIHLASILRWRRHIFVPSTAGNFIGAQLSGIPNTGGVDEFAQWGVQAAPYKFQNLHAVAHVVPAFFDTASPLRTTHLRDPEGPATSFAVESFMDELAAAAKADPIDFRLKYLDDARAKAVLTAAAEKAGWDKRTSPKKSSGSGEIAKGRGSRSEHAQRHIRGHRRGSGSESPHRRGARDAFRVRARLRT